MMPADGFFLFFGFAPGVLRERRLHCGDLLLVRRAECTLALGEDRDLDLTALGRGRERAGRRDRTGRDDQRERKQELPLPYSHVASSRACTSLRSACRSMREPTPFRLSPFHSLHERARCLCTGPAPRLRLMGAGRAVGRQRSRRGPTDPSDRRARRGRSRGR